MSEGDPALLCLVTDRSRVARSQPEATALGELVALIERAARAGVDLIQVREPDLEDRALCDLVTAAVAATADTRAHVIVNERTDVALAAGAAGVHLKATSCPAARVRSMAPPGWVIGQSVHGVEGARQAVTSGGLDYLVLGTVFETVSKPSQSPIGPTVLGEVAAMVDVPVLGIGGITAHTASAVGQSGAAGLAAIGLFADMADRSADEWERLVRTLRRAFDIGRRSTL